MTATWAAVVVNYNAGDHLRRCVASLLADDSAGAPPDVVVVDNASSDASADAAQSAIPALRLVRAPANRGYAAGANLGIVATSAPIVAVCNPDVVVERGTAAALAERFARESDLGAIGAQIRNPGGSVTHRRDGYPAPATRSGTHSSVGGGPGTGGRGDTGSSTWIPASPAIPTGCRAAIWLRRTALDDVGGWDERYFMYLEDVDLCWRLRRQGWRVAYEPAGVVTHVQAVSTRRHPYRMIVEHHRSTARFAARRWTGLRRLLLAPLVLFLALRAGVVMAAYALGRRPGNEKVGR